MMGRQTRSESLFYYFRLEDQVPENHLLRLIDRHVSFDFVREKLRDTYSDTGRPSIDPEVLLRILLIGYLYGITSERKLIEELRMHLAWRWFTGLGFDQEIPHHSTFSKNRHGRFQESKLSPAAGRAVQQRTAESSPSSSPGSTPSPACRSNPAPLPLLSLVEQQRTAPPHAFQVLSANRISSYSAFRNATRSAFCCSVRFRLKRSL